MKYNWHVPEHWLKIKTIDAHTAGEPLRIIVHGLPAIPGKSILEKRQFFREHLDHLRTGILWEPRGHADHYGAILTEPEMTDSNFGVFFLHNEGYSTMCGHAILALTKVIFQTGMMNPSEGINEIRYDTPAGLVKAWCQVSAGAISQVSFLNVPSFVYLQDQTINIPELGVVKYDVAFGGAFYAFCEANELELALGPSNYSKLVDTGMLLKHAIAEQISVRHPFEEELGFLYGIIFTASPKNPDHHSRHVCVFANGEIDRSPTGTGVSARVAILRSRNELKAGCAITIESIVGSTMRVEIERETSLGPYKAVIPRVSGEAYITGRHEFLFDPDDNFADGFILR